jgi:hypothetical protein
LFGLHFVPGVPSDGERWLERYITESAPNPQSVAKVVASLAGRIED